jgi:predicted Rossmann fold flavoprotein
LKVDVVVIGAGAAGLMAASKSGERGRNTVILDHAKQPGKKILISGGGRCNFTNYYIEPEKYLCENPHFCKSALNQYTQWDFISMVEKYKIPYHEKTLGQLFCDDSAKDIVSMLINECVNNNVEFSYQTEILDIIKLESGNFLVKTNKIDYQCESVVIATGGLSMPRLGATPFAYKIAEKFGLNILPTRAGLVPFTLDPILKDVLAEVSGISTNVTVKTRNTSFSEDMLVTHRGLSGPAILQISSYWYPGESVEIDLLPNKKIEDVVAQAISQQPNISIKNLLSSLFAKRLVDKLVDIFDIPNVSIKQLNNRQLETLSKNIHSWTIKPSGTEGYRTAEVTLGGLNTDHLSSKTMEVKSVSGLFFIGEAIDVTGWLGGYNFQWAWSSGYVAGIHT